MKAKLRTPLLRGMIASGLVWLGSACSPVTVLNAVIPEQGYQRIDDIAYGKAPRQTLDIYLSQQPQPKRSTVVFFYGGSWESGDKKQYKFVAEALTSAGFDVVIPDYRAYPEVLFPAFVEDGAAALSWVKDNINQYGGNADRLFVAGHSAGAHIAALLVLDQQYLKRHDLQAAELNGMIGMAGPYDFLPLKSRTLKTIFGPESTRWQSQPIHYADGNNPPMLLLVGNNDLTVWPKNSRHLAAEIRENNGNVKLVEFEDYGHVAMVAKLARPLRGDGRLLDTITTFIHRH